MFVDQAGEHIADIMTMSRSLSGIPSASAILDTSNYTFQAVSYGKDSEGFKYHAHKILTPSGDGIIKVISYGLPSTSSYSSSATAAYLNYNQYPSSPKPTDTRLEEKSTVPNYSSGVPDLGQYLNPSIHPQLSSVSHLVGGIPAASGSKYQIFDTSNNLIISGALLGSVYNLSGLMDASGFLNFAQTSLTNHQALYLLSENLVATPNALGFGVIRSAESTFPSEVSLKWGLFAGECGALNLFGGVYHIGLWCLDIKQMLKEGNTPPYSFNPLNNIRRYRLFAKKTFNKDITFNEDQFGVGSFIPLFQNGTAAWDLGLPVMILKWNIRFV